MIEGALQRAGELAEQARPEEALEILSRAEESITDAIPRHLAGTVLAKEAEICYSVYDWDRAISFSKKASAYFLKDGDYASYSDCIMDVAEASFVNGDISEAREMLDLTSRQLENIDQERANRYYETFLELLLSDDSAESTKSIAEILSSYFKEGIAPLSIDWLTVSQAYYRIGDRQEADRCLTRYERYDPSHKTYPPYYKYKAKLEKANGESSKALSAYERYVFLCDSLDSDILDEGTRHIKESYRRSEGSLRERLTASRRTALTIIGALLGIFLLYYVITLFVKYLKNKRLHNEVAKRASELYEGAHLERDILRDIRNNGEGLGEAAEKAIKKRLSAIERLIGESVGEDIESISSHLDRLEELASTRKEFIFSTAFGYACNHPKTMSWLKGKGLTDAEIVYCAMFLLGMNNKEISSFISSGNGYNLASSVRKKMGLTSHDTNLNLFLRSTIVERDAKN